MISYKDFAISTATTILPLKLDGKHGFFMFLKLIDDMKMNFIKTGHYLNTGKYQYFFTTENIKDKGSFLGYFRESLSLQTTCRTAEDLKDNRISFYFGIKNNNLEYGFQDDMKRDIYKTGLFKVDTKYVRSLRSYKCLSLIEGILKNANLKSLNILQEVKNSLKEWYQGKGSILILTENVIKKTFDKSDFKKEELEDPINLQRKYENWCEKFKWYNKVYCYIDSEDDDKVTFYAKIKPKENVDQEL